MTAHKPDRVLLATTCSADDRKTLAAVRSLGRSGVHVTVGGDRFAGQAFYSRYVRSRIRYPHPATGLDAFVQALANALEKAPPQVLLPMNDYTTLGVASGRAILEANTRVVAPSLESLEVARDKYETLRLGREIGLRVPATYCPTSEQEVQELAKGIGYPCVVKLRSGAGAVGMSQPRSSEELLRRFQSAGPSPDIVFSHDKLLVQEFIPAEEHDVCVLFRHGEPRAALTQRRLRMYPVHGGVGVLVETTSEEWLVEQAFALLRALRWHGPAQVEFRADPRKKQAWLLEVNGRFWGTLGLAVAAGIDFPMLACRMALEDDTPAVFRYQVGLRCRWPIPYGILHLVGGERPWRTLREFFGPSRQTRSDLMLADPLPTLAELAFIAQRVWRRGYLFDAGRAGTGRANQEGSTGTHHAPATTTRRTASRS